MTPLRQRLLETLRLRGYAERTQESYVAAVRMLAEHYHRSPDRLTDEELRQYFLHLIDVKRISASTLRLTLTGVKFFYEQVLQRNFPTLALTRPQKEKRLPAVLSIEEVQRLLSCVRHYRYQVFLSTVYACGLRLQEATRLRVGDVDGTRQLLHVHLGKGHRDRYVPLPQQQLEVLRAYWQTHRHPEWLFPGRLCEPLASTPRSSR